MYVFAALIEFAVISYYDSPSFEQARQLVRDAKATKDDNGEVVQVSDCVIRSYIKCNKKRHFIKDVDHGSVTA